MASEHNHNKACCSIPPVKSDYTPKGTTKPYAGFSKVYVTGDVKAKHALVCVYDIFGFAPQTQQGADMLAEALQTAVYVPDFFEPDPPYPESRFPPVSEEDQQFLGNFFGTTANPGKAIEGLTRVAKQLKADGAQKVGAYGFCWGGKVCINAGGEGTPLDAVSIVHPAMLSAEDSQRLTVPLGMYITKDEPVEEYNKIIDVLKSKPFASKCDYHNYQNMFHGFAAARANLKDDENKKEFEGVYGKLANYFQAVL